jgi:hypothetical protein
MCRAVSTHDSQKSDGHKRNEHERFCLDYVSIRWLGFCSLAQSLTALTAAFFSLKITSGGANHVGLFIKSSTTLQYMHSCDARLCFILQRETFTFRSARRELTPHSAIICRLRTFFRLNMLMVTVLKRHGVYHDWE